MTADTAGKILGTLIGLLIIAVFVAGFLVTVFGD